MSPWSGSRRDRGASLEQRARRLGGPEGARGPVVYWMSRDQRVGDNWALLYAQGLARQRQEALAVVFCLAPAFLGATHRHYHFMLEGLRETALRLESKNIAFSLLPGDPGKTLPRFLSRIRAGSVVTDFDPLRIKRGWRQSLAETARMPVYEVDAHNIIPCWLASEKQEFAARTLRPKIHRLLPAFLTPMPYLRKHLRALPGIQGQPDWTGVHRRLAVDREVGPVDWLRPGEKAARTALNLFIRDRLPRYADRRNDPNAAGESGLSPYLHFGQLSAQRVALEVMAADASPTEKETFLEELLVRRELSDNFCYYNEQYDAFEGFPEWARKTLDRHRRDRREYSYTRAEFEAAKTHDPLWNAAQTEMTVRGKMHGYLRMYWAKKILEWSPSPEDAMEIAIYLNDRYELDGRDPNGYTGIAWSMGGVHDRPWGERPIFGTVRYMSAAGCRRKFDVNTYVRHWLGGGGNEREPSMVVD